MATPGQMILSARKRKKLTQQQLATMFNVTGATISQWENDATVPAPKKVRRVASELGLDREEFQAAIDERELPPAQGSLPMGKAAIFRERREEFMPAQPTAQPYARRDIPVWASAAGSEEGTMIITAEPIDWIQRSELMRDTVNPFAFFVIGDSMSDVIEHGDQVVINPSKPPRPGKDHVFISEGEGVMLATVKRLVRIKPNAWRVKQFNPVKEFDLPMSKWSKAHRITEKRYGD